MKRLLLFILLISLATACHQVNYQKSICLVWSYKHYKFGTQVTCVKQGTGFLIAPDTVLTCAHVVMFGSPSFMHRSTADSVICVFAIQADTVVAIVVNLDLKLDFAKLYLPDYHGTPLKLRKLPLTYTSTQQFGSLLHVYGYPNGKWSAFTARAIEPDTSGIRVIALIDDRHPLGGASGSPIFYKGYVIGVLQEQGRGGYTHKRFIGFRLIQ